jgi:hypothetical protein
MRKSSLIVAVGAFALFVAACPGGSDESAAVRPFSEIQATEAVFENDPTFPGGGILRVNTEKSTGGNTGAIEIRAFSPVSMHGG